jgi:endoglycosylceramidase
VFETSYVTRYLDQDIKWAKQYSMYVVLDMHQWKWASRFGGSGAPHWTVRQYDPTEAGMGEAAANFWLNSTLQNHLIQVSREIARIHADETTIAGYDLLNEPWAIGQSVIPHLNATNVEKFYLNAIRAIRAVDSNHIIFLEPPRISAFSLPLNDKNIVYSPHFYPLSFFSRYVPGNEEVLEADLAAKYTNFVLESGRPIWIGEFGAFMQDGSYVNWLRDAIGIFNKYQIGWAWWGVSPGQEIPSVLFQSTTS